METPEYIGRYRIIRRLGAGGMGEVYLAHDGHIRRKVAIKRLMSRGLDAALYRERFRREAQSIATLNHPAIVKIYDVITSSDADCIVMEYVDGKMLREHIGRWNGQALTVLQIVRVGRQIAEGMAEAHAKGIIHRDLKSENVLLDRNGDAKIIDFGIARVLSDKTLTEQGKILGTYKAMSPEQIRGDDVKEPSDLFSFGILLYEALAGELPFTGAGLEQLVWAITRYEPPSLSTQIAGFPEALSGLVAQLLQKHPRLRPHSFHEVAGQLKEIEDGMDDGTASSIPAPIRPSTLTDGQSTEDVPNWPESPDAPGPGPTVGDPMEPWDGDASGEPSNAEPVVDTRRRRHRPAIVGAGLALAILAATVFWPGDTGEGISGVMPMRASMGSDGQPERKHAPITIGPRYVAVLPVAVSDACIHDTVLVTRTIHHDIEEALLALAGVHVIADAEREPLKPGASRPELARALAADELLATRVACYPDRLLIEIQRIEADGTLGKQSAPFEMEVSDLGLSSASVRQQVKALYPEREPRDEAMTQDDARHDDLARFQRLRQDYWRKEPRISHEDMLNELAEILTTSPRFLDGYVFAAEVWLHRYYHEPDPGHLDQAWALMQRARALAPFSQRVLMRYATVALARGDTEGCESALTVLDTLDPGSGVTLYMHSLVQEYRDDTPGARILLQQAAARHPSWRILYHLAKLDLRMGDIQAARQHLGEVFARSPENQAALQLQTLIESRTKADGNVPPLDPSQEHAYSVLVNHAARLMNQQRYGEAIPFLEQARIKRPNGAEAVFNLAEVLILAGDTERARRAFQTVLTMVPGDEQRASPLALRAQALAHLGRAAEAHEAMARALARKQDLDISYAAAVVYALAGDTRAAVIWAERALKDGHAKQWFDYPWFEAVRAESPRLRALFADPRDAPEQP